MDYIIRNEEEKDYYEIENVVREAFWNVYRPGCNEHLVIHNFRNDPAFIKELDFVVEKDGEIVGSIIYSYAKLKLDDGRVKDFICFGPVGIRPDYQNAGLGQELIYFSLKEAQKLGHTVVFITGHHKYYQKLGFESASKYGVFLDNNRDGELTPILPFCITCVSVKVLAADVFAAFARSLALAFIVKLLFNPHKYRL